MTIQPSFRFAGIAAAIPLLIALLPAQAMRVERRAYLRLERLRTEIAVAWLTADAEQRTRAAAAIAEPLDGQPFCTATRALLALRGHEADDLALYRGGILGMVLPEIVDQDVYQSVYVTAHAPRILPDVGRPNFRVTLVDDEGEEVGAARIADDTAMDDVLRFRATTSLPMVESPAGSYTVRIATFVGDDGPRPYDVAIEQPVWVLPGFKQRVEALPVPLDGSEERMAAVTAMTAEIPEARRDPLSRALLFGALWQVERVWRAEPRLPGVDPVVDLARAERIFTNLREDRPALAGVHGRVVVGLPIEDAADRAEIVQVSVDLPPARDADVTKPLVVVLPAAPAWDSQADRPISTRSVPPSILHDRLDRVGFDRDGRFHVAVLESPGRYANAVTALRDATRWLKAILPVGDRPVFWVGEREGAYAVSRAVVADPGAVRGIVLAAGTGLTTKELAELGDVSILGVPAAGHAATMMLERLAAAAGPERMRLTPADDAPWPVTLAVRAEAVESFLVDCAFDD